MKTISALDVRRRFGELLDQAAAGERIVIERAGQPMAVLVPLSDLDHIDPERRKHERLRAIEEVKRFPIGLPPGFDVAEAVREMRRERDGQIMRAINDGREAPDAE